MSDIETILRQQAEGQLGTAIEPLEWDRAKAYAEHKLKAIIEREGDADGVRQEPWYLIQLIAESVKGSRLSQFTYELWELNQYIEQMGIKKDSPHHKT